MQTYSDGRFCNLIKISSSIWFYFFYFRTRRQSKNKERTEDRILIRLSIFGEWIQVRFYLTLLFTNFKIAWEISDFFLSWVGKNIGGTHVEEISDLRKKNLKTSLSLRKKSIFGGTVGWEKLKSSEKSQIWENFSVVGPEARILTLYKHPSLYSMFTRPLYIMHIKHKWSQCCLFWWIFYHLLLHAYIYSQTCLIQGKDWFLFILFTTVSIDRCDFSPLLSSKSEFQRKHIEIKLI